MAIREEVVVDGVSGFNKLDGVHTCKLVRIYSGVASDFYDQRYIDRFGIDKDKPMKQLIFELPDGQEIKRAFSLSARSMLVMFQGGAVGDFYQINFASGKIVSAIRASERLSK